MQKLMILKKESTDIWLSNDEAQQIPIATILNIKKKWNFELKLCLILCPFKNTPRLLITQVNPQ